MANASRSEAQVAFIAAAVVLLALPLLAALGLALFVMASAAVSGSQGEWLAWTLFGLWVVLVVVALLLFAVRLTRRQRS